MGKKKEDLKISYVLPVLNSQATIAQCLKSLLKQEIPAHEIIIIDDGSTDYTVHIIKEMIKLDERKVIRLIQNKERKGSAYSRNMANNEATGDVIAVCDADFYEPNRSKAISVFFEEFPEKSIFYSALECRDADNPQHIWRVDAFEWDFNSKCPISHPTVAYKKEVTNEIEYHEESVDTDLYEFFLLDAHKKGYLFGGCQESLMIKIEGNTYRDRSDARLLKIKKYEKLGIKVDM